MNDAELNELQRATFGYFPRETNPANGLVPDNTGEDAPASIAAIGLGLASYTVAAERSFMPREEAAARTLTTLRFFWDAPQGNQSGDIGHKGFYYHFLNMYSGRRAGECELSTMDTAILIAGVLASGVYFDQDNEVESEIRRLADALYRRVDWKWALNGGPTVAMGWKPESGFINFRYEGYNEALLLYILGLGSPTHPLPRESYDAFTSTYCWRETYGQEYVYAGPLFIHQLAHAWIDFRRIQDSFMREKGIDYFENSRRATYAQREYASRNPLEYHGYSKNCWGLTASSGPSPVTLLVDGVQRQFFGYVARGAPFGPDDGTLAPWAVAASLPFAPEIVIPALRHIDGSIRK